MKRIILALALLLASVGGAAAQNCAGFPFTLTNGTTADATQVMADFNLLLTCANTSLAHNGNNSDITSLSSLTTPLSVSQGGTGFNSLTANNLIIGNGTTAPLFLPPVLGGLAYSANGTAWTSTNALTGAAIGIGRAPTTEELEVMGAVKSVSSGANFNAGGAGAVMDYNTGTGQARIGSVNGGGTSTSTAILAKGAAVAIFQDGVQIDTPTGGDKGVGSLNSSKQHYQNGSPVSAGVWAQYDGTGIAVLASYNLTSVTKNGTGDYTFNFTTSFTTANFACTVASTAERAFIVSQASGNVRVSTRNSGGSQSDSVASVVCFGQQ